MSNSSVGAVLVSASSNISCKTVYEMLSVQLGQGIAMIIYLRVIKHGGGRIVRVMSCGLWASTVKLLTLECLLGTMSSCKTTSYIV
jgi:hypothetical protein